MIATHVEPRKLIVLLAGAAWLFTFQDVQARFMRLDLEKVPLQRLLTNLRAQAEKNPKNAQVRLNLARAHAMAYALKVDTADIWKGKEQDGIWFGYTPAFVPFTAKPTKDADKRKIAHEHLDSAIRWYRETLKLDPKNLTARLGLAWAIDQAGRKEAAIKAYREVIESAWTKEKELKLGRLGGNYVTAEAAGYLIALLDPATDQTEIKELRQRASQLQKLPRPVTPIVVPLRDGLTVRDLEDRTARVLFDADGSALPRRWTWITREAGWLVFDQKGERKIASGLQLFGNVTFWMFWANGYEALRALDANGDGWLTGRELEGLAVWQDVNGDGICDANEVKSLAELGIVALSCRYQIDPHHPDRIAFAPNGVVFRDGRRRPTFDIVLQPR
jgi:tetratricopeptide (TPR) repeat protein